LEELARFVSNQYILVFADRKSLLFVIYISSNTNDSIQAVSTSSLAHVHIIPQQDACIATRIKYYFPPMVNPPYYEEDWGWLRTPRIGYVPVIYFIFLFVFWKRISSAMPRLSFHILSPLFIPPPRSTPFLPFHVYVSGHLESLSIFRTSSLCLNAFADSSSCHG